MLPRAFGGDNCSYHQVGMSDDQELVEFSERTQLVRGIAPSLPVSQQLGHPGTQPVQQV